MQSPPLPFPKLKRYQRLYSLLELHHCRTLLFSRTHVPGTSGVRRTSCASRLVLRKNDASGKQISVRSRPRHQREEVNEYLPGDLTPFLRLALFHLPRQPHLRERNVTERIVSDRRSYRLVPFSTLLRFPPLLMNGTQVVSLYLRAGEWASFFSLPDLSFIFASERTGMEGVLKLWKFHTTIINK